MDILKTNALISYDIMNWPSVCLNWNTATLSFLKLNMERSWKTSGF